MLPSGWIAEQSACEKISGGDSVKLALSFLTAGDWGQVVESELASACRR